MKTHKGLSLSNSGYLVLIFFIALFMLMGCGTFQPEMDPTAYYRKDITVTVGGKAFEGVAVLPRQSSYTLELKPKADMDVLSLKSCHREFIAEKASGGGLFNKKDYKYQYEPVRYIEDEGICPLHIDALESGTNEYSGAFVEFQDPRFQLSSRLYCNGSLFAISGVGACQARAGSIQVLAVDEPIRFAPAPEHCSTPKYVEGHYEIIASKGECLYVFDTKAGQKGRVTLLGYDELVLREIK